MQFQNTLNYLSKAFIVMLPLISSLIIFLTLLNLSIWIFDENRVKQSIKKSKKVLFIGLLFFSLVALVIFLVQVAMA
jgi:hypothetical protein